MELGVEFQMIWSDNDVFDLRVAAWNGAFGGMAEIYAAIGGLEAAANQLRGFPSSPTDKRVLEFGCLDRKYAGGGVKMRFHCVDGAGHAYVELTIDSNCTTGGTIQTAFLTVPIEASAVDAFVDGLVRLELKRDGTARLRGMHEARHFGA